ncbi:E3 ubiquitin-protein ligase Praja-2 isoform X4 [Chiloscyllium punctatum]|uniref:E3 ubiquitin-protein ligase Praja-2 isoform X4 n=1 Tax=Chiloscyllium punctatum TaxID=137246 RepID=UPI003B636B61
MSRLKYHRSSEFCCFELQSDLTVKVLIMTWNLDVKLKFTEIICPLPRPVLHTEFSASLGRQMLKVCPFVTWMLITLFKTNGLPHDYKFGFSVRAPRRILTTKELLPQCTACDLTMDAKSNAGCEPQKEHRFLPSSLNQRLFQCESNDFALPSSAEPLDNYSGSQSTGSSKWSIPNDFFETDSRSPTGIGFVNIDSYEPESSEGEDEDSNIQASLQKEGKLQKRLDTMLSELEKGVDYLNGLQSYLSAVMHDGNSSQIELPCSLALDNLTSADIAVKGHQTELKEHRKTLPAVGSMEEINTYVKMEDVKEKRERNLDKASLSVQTEGNIFCCMTEEPSSSEMVVRPKVRKEMVETHSKRDQSSPDEFYSYCTGDMKANSRNECCGSNCALWNCRNKLHRDSKIGSGLNGKETTCIQKEQAAIELKETLEENSFWDDFENYCNKGETREQTSLEEGEIPWVAFNEESDSSSSNSTDETEGLGQLAHSGLLILDDNNNFEDDSSVSEDLDMEWRLLDELGEGLTAQAISSVDPQLLTFMALEERLAQAMEAALAHLESLAIDGEQAPPPAPKETIECLPQVSISEGHNGLEQSCAICCSEYVKEELVTELPCHHLFHRPCVTLWLQKSGTCPVCRHILTSTLPETATTAFLSEPEIPPSTCDGPAIR